MLSLQSHKPCKNTCYLLNLVPRVLMLFGQWVPGAHPLTKSPEDSGYKIGSYLKITFTLHPPVIVGCPPLKEFSPPPSPHLSLPYPFSHPYPPFPNSFLAFFLGTLAFYGPFGGKTSILKTKLKIYIYSHFN